MEYHQLSSSEGESDHPDQAISSHNVALNLLDPSTRRRDLVAMREIRSPMGTPKSRRKRRGKTNARDPHEDTRTTEGDLFELSPEFGKKKWSKKNKGRFKPGVNPIGSPFVGKKFSPEHAEDSKKDGMNVPIDEEIQCLVAKTALILPFYYKSSESVAPNHWVNQLLDRKMHTSKGESPIWEHSTHSIKEIGDLSPLFQQVFGWRKGEKDSRIEDKLWSCQRLSVTQNVMEELFESSFLCTLQNGEQVPYEVAFDSIELFLYPLGAAMLVIHVNWLPENKKHHLSLHDMRTLLNISKYRHKLSEVCCGWGFTPAQESDLLKPNVPPEQNKELGEIYAARYQHETVSLSTLGNWLIHLADEDPTNPSERLDLARHTTHLTTVVVDKRPPADVLDQYLFHLRHAYGQKNRPPVNSNETLGKVLVWRLNRYIGLCKEGIVSFSWPLNQNIEDDFEFNFWSQKFLGIYLLLAVHAHGEKLVLFELSDLAAGQADKLRLESEVSNFTEIKNSRNSMRQLASLMVRYTLGMSSNDCGGTSEYTDFFTSLRFIFGIPDLRNELSNEMKDVLAVVESTYLEEERRMRDEQEVSRRKNYEIQKALSNERSQQNDAFQILLSIIGSFTFPFVLVSGMWGMNMSNLPDVNFYVLIGIMFAISIMILILLMLFRWYLRHASEKRKKNIRNNLESGEGNLVEPWETEHLHGFGHAFGASFGHMHA